TIREESDSIEWQDWLVSDSPDQETMLAASEEFDNRRRALAVALGALKPRARRIFEGRRLGRRSQRYCNGNKLARICSNVVAPASIPTRNFLELSRVQRASRSYCFQCRSPLGADWL